MQYTTQFSYDPADRMATVTYPTGEVATQTYNARGLPATLSGTVAGIIVTSSTYNQLGLPSQVDLGNGLRTVFNYHGVDTVDTGDATSYWGKPYRAKTYKISDGSERLHLKYWWDAAGNLTQRQNRRIATDPFETENFGYDFLDRLIGVSGPYTESYAYNTIGNITSMNDVSYTYGAKPHAVTQIGSTGYVYDANGNMTTRGTQTLTWDVENRLVSVVDGGLELASYKYDGDGNRIKKIEGGQTTFYPNKYYEWNISTGQATLYYYFGSSLVALRRGSTLEYIQQDHLTSTSVSTDGSGAEKSALKYLPFGATHSSTGTLGTDKKFTGQRLDSTGLYYYNARYYDPGIGRFISADSWVSLTARSGRQAAPLTVAAHNQKDLRVFLNGNLPQAPFDPQLLNRYSYVANNPLKYVDPEGHFLDWLWDIFMVAYDIVVFVADPSLENAAYLGADVVLGLIPGVPAGSRFVVKFSNKAIKSSKIGKALEQGARLAAEKTAHLRIGDWNHVLSKSHVKKWEKLVKDPLKNQDTVESIIRDTIANGDKLGPVRTADNGDILQTYFKKYGDEVVEVRVNESTGEIGTAFVR